MRTSELALLLCAGIMLSGGALLGVSTAWGLARMWYHLWLSGLGVELAAAVPAAAAALLCLPAGWLAAALAYHPRSLPMHATLMCLSMTSMLVLSVAVSALGGLSRALRAPAALNASLQRAMPSEITNPYVRSAFASMQLQLKCCGASSYKDWLQHRESLPPFCCNRVYPVHQYGVMGTLASVKNKVGEPCHSPVFTTGCLAPALAELRAFVTSTSALAAAVIVVMASTMFASAYILVSSVTKRCSLRTKSHQKLHEASATPGMWCLLCTEVGRLTPNDAAAAN